MRAANEEKTMKAILWSVIVFVGIVWVFCQPQPVRAQGRAQAARAAADFLIERLGPQAARESVEVLARRIESMAAKHGEDVFLAVKKCGPAFFDVVEAAGANGAKAVRIMAEHGEPGVAWVLSRPTAMKLVAQYGEEVAAVLARNPGGICEPAIEQLGRAAVRALQATGTQSGRRLAMMLSDGALAKIGRTPELLGVVARYGDRAMEFIWKNKGALAVGAALTAFIVDPEPFLNGGKELSNVVAQNLVRPLAEVPAIATKEVAAEVARKTNWTLLFLVIITVLALFAAVKWGLLWPIAAALPTALKHRGSAAPCHGQNLSWLATTGCAGGIGNSKYRHEKQPPL